MATADPLYELLSSHLPQKANPTPTPTHDRRTSISKSKSGSVSTEDPSKYLSRILSLSLSDLSNTEPQSLSQAAHSNLLSIQALSSRSHRSTTASSDRLATLSDALPSLERSTIELRSAVPGLDESAVNFASSYGRARLDRGADDDDFSARGPITTSSTAASTSTPQGNEALKARKDSQLLARQADKVQDILELPSLLRASIAAAAATSAPPHGASNATAAGTSSSTSSTTTTSAANYSQALDLFTHIRRLQILYPDSQLIRSLQYEAELAMHDMTTALLASLRSQNIRLASAIRTIGWLRRVIPQLSSSAAHSLYSTRGTTTTTTQHRGYETGMSGMQKAAADGEDNDDEDLFGPLFLVSRLSAFLSITTEALAPLRDLADQETEKRLAATTLSTTTGTGSAPPQPTRRPSGTPSAAVSGQQTERYLKRYIEVFREHSFPTVQMYRNIFPHRSSESSNNAEHENLLKIPSAVASFPLHLASLLMETLQTYLPNVTDPAARESLLMQVLYAANSLGRLGADFTMMIAMLDLPDLDARPSQLLEKETEQEINKTEPEWLRVIKKHRIQAAKLDAMAANPTT